MKKLFSLVLVVIGILVLTQCSYFQPIEKNGAAGIGIVAKDFDIIGPIRVEAGLKSGYKSREATYDYLLEKAKSMGGDDVINLSYDVEGKWHIFSGFSNMINSFTGNPAPRYGIGTPYKLIINGIVIKYKDAGGPVEGTSGNAQIVAPF